MKNRMKLGRKIYDVITRGEATLGEDGMWKEANDITRQIRANIQGGIFWNSVKDSDAGEIRKMAISIRSDEELIFSDGKRKGDLVVYDNCHWEVRDCRKYGNLRATRHWEAMAVLVDRDVYPRSDL